MNIEEAIEILKQEPNFSLNYYNRENAIDVLLTAYEKQSKEIEEYKKQLDLDYVDKLFVPVERYDQLKKEIEELKEKNKELNKSKNRRIRKIIQILEAKPYTAYTLYGEILHESDEIAQMLKEVLKKE